MLITGTRSDEQARSAGAGAVPDGDDALDDVVLDFGGGIPGFPASRHFAIESLAPELQPFCVMRSVDETGISFVLVPPGALFPDYTIEIDEQHVATLGLESADDAVVLAIVTLGQPPTANLLGPLVVNRRTRAAAQVVQYQSSYRAAEPLASRSD
ncbi:MAG TPA: flagellar assembly protein FliW [Acidimicrobiales bacterium]|nr:flagellar assembly protein FliW [Acidimicrobiales bacterium]